MCVSATDNSQPVMMWVKVSEVVWISLLSMVDFMAGDRLASGLGGGVRGEAWQGPDHDGFLTILNRFEHIPCCLSPGHIAASSLGILGSPWGSRHLTLKL